MSLNLSSQSPLKSSGGATSAWRVLLTEILHQPKRSSADLSADVRQPFVPAGMKAPSVPMCNLCLPNMAPFSDTNVHVLEKIGPFGGARLHTILSVLTGSVLCRNLFRRRQKALSERPVSVSVGI